jgi:type VI secretion system protein ImpF
MHPNLSSRHVTQSLFDRLTDTEPRSKNDLPTTGWEQMRELKAAVARDLTNLLNVRRNEADIPDEYEQTNRSIVAYGIRDFTSSPFDMDQIRRSIEKCIRTFEPRLSHVTVQLSQSVQHRLDFRISALLHIDVHSEPVLFDAVLPAQSRRFQVSEGG